MGTGLTVAQAGLELVNVAEDGLEFSLTLLPPSKWL